LLHNKIIDLQANIGSKIAVLYIVKQLPMTTLYLVLKISALLMTLILPLRRPRLSSKNDIELSDLAINAKGELENLAETEARNHPIKIKH
jgi:hypothetical protein